MSGTDGGVGVGVVVDGRSGTAGGAGGSWYETLLTSTPGFDFSRVILGRAEGSLGVACCARRLPSPNPKSIPRAADPIADRNFMRILLILLIIHNPCGC